MTQQNQFTFKKLNSHDTFSMKTGALFLVKNHSDQYCHLDIFTGNEKTSISLKPDWAGMFFCVNNSLQRNYGSCDYYCIDLKKLAKLQAFIDCMTDFKSITKTKKNHSIIIEEPQVKAFSSFRDVEYWYINQVYQGATSLEPIITFLRSTESYLLVSFLIQESNSNVSNIESLSKKYGLSSSYFRQLCRQVLGNSLKRQFCDWRLMCTLIDMIKSELSMTDAACKAGYSSLSHFCKDVKNTLGSSTRVLKKSIFS